MLYFADKKLSGWKKYRIPSHNNPFYSQADDLDNIREAGGTESDNYQQLVAAKHGAASFTVITRDQIKQEIFPFYQFRYGSVEQTKGIDFTQHLERPELKGFTILCAGIDCGFTDPTIVSIMGLDKSGIWRMVLRYRIQRVESTTVEKIIDWLDSFYHFDTIGIDIGSGGGGAQIIHSFLYRDEFRKKNYDTRVIGVQFGERVAVGFDAGGKELVQTTKSLGASILVQKLQQSQLMLSEIDHEAVSQIERITKIKGINGDDKYFILSEKGNGPSNDDHLFASLICWAIATRDMSFQKKKRKRLGKSSGAY